MFAIVVGPGPLALGLIVPALRDAQFDICLVGRPDAAMKEQTSYLLGWRSAERGLEPREVAFACNAGTLTELDEQVRAKVASAEPLLITCSLGAGAPSCVRFLSELIEARPTGSETMLVVCENAPDAVYADLEHRYGDRVVFCRSIVDRVCSWPEHDAGRYTAEGEKIIRAHPVGEWVIPHASPAESKLVERLRSAPDVVMISPQARPLFADRKVWTVNGLHLVLGLVARSLGLDSAREAADGQGFQEIAAQLWPVIETALRSVHGPLDRYEQYVVDRVAVFCEMPEETRRLTRSLTRHDLRPLMARFDARVCAAARAGVAAGCDAEPFLRVVELLLDVLSRPECYEPPDDGQSVELDASVDREVVQLFAAALDRWAPEDERVEFVERLGRMLEAQRDLAL